MATVTINKVKKPSPTMADVMRGREPFLDAVWNLFVENDESIAIICHNLSDYHYTYNETLKAMSQTYSIEQKVTTSIVVNEVGFVVRYKKHRLTVYKKEKV